MNAIIRTATLAAVLSLITSQAIAADGVLIVQKQTTDGATQTSQIQIEKTRMRAEIGGRGGAKQVMVFDGTAQVMRIINTEKKTYMELTKADVDRLGSQMAGAMTKMQEQMKNMPPEQRERMEAMMKGRGMPAAPAKTEYRKTGTDKVGKWTCDKYDGYQNNQKVAEICTVDPAALGFNATDFELTKQVAAFFHQLMPQNAGQMFTMGGTEQGYSGFPVRHMSSIGQRQTTTELSEVTRKAFDEAGYAVPAGFQKQAFPGGRGRQQ